MFPMKTLNLLCTVRRYQTEKRIMLNYTVQVNITSNWNVVGQTTMQTFLAISFRVKLKISMT